MDYNNNELLPINLPCGHTLCFVCIQRLTRDAKIECPNDREQYYTIYASINFVLKQLMEAINNQHGEDDGS